MKKKDIALIIVIACISAAVSLLISGKIFGSPTNRQQQVEVVQPITTDFPQPDKAYFNSSAFDPTQPLSISQNANPNPFNGSGSQ